ncbi:MAG: peptide deformylase [Patescibacteria group bacterium]|nr:peptide deformylase [Patescibacteria group bacterium]
MVKDTLQAGDSRLKASNQKVTDVNDSKVKQVIVDLVETMKANELVGMAAPQIGENYQIIITEPRQTKTRSADQADELRVYINPKIIHFSEEKSTIYEGCGSVAKGTLFGPVIRPKEITIEALDKNGQRFELTCDGLLARVIQHEYDHLSGIEFTEKIADYRLLKDIDFYMKDIKGSSEQINASVITKKVCKKF